MANDITQLSRREREEAFRKDIVLDAAEALFAEKGIDGTTVSDIADRAELAKGSLYLLFGSKQEIVSAIVRRKVKIVLEEVENVFSMQVEPIEKISMLIESKLRSMWASKDFARLFVNELKGFNWDMEIPILEVAKGEIHSMLEKIQTIIIEAQKRGQIKPDLEPRIVLATMGGVTNSVVHLLLKEDIDVDIDLALEQVREIFLGGIVPSEKVKK